MRTFRTGLLTAAFVAGAFPVAIPAPACAAEGPSAVLVVDTGSDDIRLCVSLDDDQVSGIELIVLAAEQHGLDYRLGYGGDAVCMLAGVGTESDDCFDEYPNFWAYWRGDGSGGWSYSSTGAAQTTVEAGDVEGWSWGSGNDPSSHQRPPETTYAAVCGAPAAEDRSLGESRGRSGSGGDENGQPRDRKRSSTDGGGEDDPFNDVNENDDGNRAGDARDGERERRRKDRDGKRKDDKEGPPTDRAETMDEAAQGGTTSDGTTPSSDSSEDDPPWLGIAGLGVAAALVALGVAFDRRRRRV